MYVHGPRVEFSLGPRENSEVDGEINGSQGAGEDWCSCRNSSKSVNSMNYNITDFFYIRGGHLLSELILIPAFTLT